MKEFIIMLLMFSIPMFCFAEELTSEPKQTIKNENSYLGINIEKQPQQKNNEQLITNKKSFLFINIVINGKIKENK